MKIPCRTPGCRNLAVFRTSKCFDHGVGAEPTIGEPERIVKPERQVRPIAPMVHDWDIICLLCADRRAARGTEDDATATRLRLGNVRCGQCGGSLLVERSDIGAISSPSAGRSSIYQPTYGISSRPRIAAA